MATQETFESTESSGRPSVDAADRELTLSFQAGDRDAYDSIYARYSGRVHVVCQRILGDSQDAQDAAQETFLRVYQALPRFNGRYHLGAWITRIATNVCLDHLRARARTPSDVAPNDVLEEVVVREREDDPEEVVMRGLDGARVQQTLASLSPLHRRAILLRDFEGRDYKEIAMALGMSECRARVLLHRARKGFRRSWTSGWIVLGLPTRLLQRFKRIRSPGTEHVAQAATSVTQTGQAVASSPPVFSCSHVVQSCGEMVSERIAAVATAAMVSVSVAGGAAPVVADASAVTRALGNAVPGAAAALDGAMDVGRGFVAKAQMALAPDDGGSESGSDNKADLSSGEGGTEVASVTVDEPSDDDAEANAIAPDATTGSDGDAAASESMPTEEPSPEPTENESGATDEVSSSPTDEGAAEEPAADVQPSAEPTPADAEGDDASSDTAQAEDAVEDDADADDEDDAVADGDADDDSESEDEEVMPASD